MNETSTICLDQSRLRLTTYPVEKLFVTYLFPPVILVGIVGSLLTLAVLLSREMQSRYTLTEPLFASSDSKTICRANSFLAALAFFDTICLLLQIPHTLGSIDWIGTNYYFVFVYHPIKPFLITLHYWSSTVVNWLIVAVCFERVFVIRYPFRARHEWRLRNTAVIVCIVAFFSALLNFHHLMHFRCFERYICNDTQIVSKCFDVTGDEWLRNHTNPTPLFVRNYVRWSIIVNAIFAVIPNFAVVFLNITLIYYVKHTGAYGKGTPLQVPFLRLKSVVGTNDASKAKEVASVSGQINGSRSQEFTELILRRNTDSQTHQAQENKITVTVCAIVTCFTLTQGPSAVILPFEFLFANKVAWRTVMYFGYFLAMLGIALNFFLFCMISVNFRQKLRFIVISRMGSIRRRMETC